MTKPDISKTLNYRGLLYLQRKKMKSSIAGEGAVHTIPFGKAWQAIHPSAVPWAPGTVWLLGLSLTAASVCPLTSEAQGLGKETRI